MDKAPDHQQLLKRIGDLEKEIAGLKLIAEIRQKSEKEYRLIVESLSEGVILQEASGRILLWNHAAETIFAPPAQDRNGSITMEARWWGIHPDGSAFCDQSHPAAITLRTGRPCRDVPMGLVQSNGDVRWISINTTPVFFDDKDNPAAVAISFFDVTESRRAEHALRQGEERFRRLFEEAPVAIQGYSPDGVIHYWNKANEQTYGYTSEEAIGKNLLDLIIPEEMRAVAAEIIKKGAETGEMPQPMEFSLKRKDGSRVPVLSAHVAIQHDGKQTELYCLDSDLTEQKRLQAELQQAHKMEAIGTLTGGIAHDFNNILGIIIGNCELALDDIPDCNPSYFNLKEIIKAGLRAKDIVRQLLTFCHKSEHQPKPMRLIPILKDVLGFIRASIPATIEIRHDISAVEDTILSESTVVYQVMMNLCSNAAQAMEMSGGTIRISVRNVAVNAQDQGFPSDLKPGKYIQIAVSDTGPGIDPAIIDRIFDPYFTTKLVGKGTGMGLAVVQGIAKSHDGAIAVKSTLNAGATFTVFFPLTDKRPRVKIDAPDTLQLGDESILLVDDEKSIVDMCQEMLTRLGYQVETAMTPLEALEKYKNTPNRFDLVITDMTMPHMTGLQLTKRLKAINPQARIILCTGFSAYITPEKAQAMGIKGYLMKPIVKLEMASLVRRVLDDTGRNA
jgi:PAS domain S-box-containing protein